MTMRVVRVGLLAMVLGAGALSQIACGGGSAAAKGGAEAPKAETSALEDLKAIPQQISTEVDTVMQPVNDVDAAVEGVTSLPKKLKLDAKQVMAMAKATVDSGKVEIKADAKIDETAKAELEAALKKLSDVVQGLKATPERTAKLAGNVTAAVAKVPVLAGKVTAQSSVTVANPFASSDTKAKAQADLADVKTATADVQKKLSEAQTKVGELPNLATKALAKVTASFAGGGATSAKTAAK